MKEQLYMSLMQPIILYGSETLPLRKNNENRFFIFERKVLRKIQDTVKYGIIGDWRRRKNLELEALYSGSNTLRVIRRERLQLTGHDRTKSYREKNLWEDQECAEKMA